MRMKTRAAQFAAALWVIEAALLLPCTGKAQEQEEEPLSLDEPTPAPERQTAEPRATTTTTTTTTEAPWDDEGSSAKSSASDSSDDIGKLRIYAGARLGVGGGFTFKDQDSSFNAKPSYGFQVGADYALFKYFAAGLETRFSWVGPKGGAGNFVVWDLLARPRARWVLEGKRTELYLVVPFGLNFTNPPQASSSGKASATLGIAAGAQYFFNQHVGLSAELGWNWTFMHYVSKEPGPGAPSGLNGQGPLVSVDNKLRFGQLTLLALNLMFAL